MTESSSFKRFCWYWSIDCQKIVIQFVWIRLSRRSVNVDGCCWIPTYLYCVCCLCSIGCVIGMLSTVFAVRLCKCEIHLGGKRGLCSGVPHFVRSCGSLLYQHTLSIVLLLSCCVIMRLRVERETSGIWLLLPLGCGQGGVESLVRFQWERFCKEVRKIVLSAAPLYVKVTLVHAISNRQYWLPCLLHTDCRKESMLVLAGSPCWLELGVSIHLPGRE